jgi:glutamyl-tRNA synthetase
VFPPFTDRQRVVTRFAPSPTGFITLGNYRTALFSYLFALKHQGVFLLRIEDTDLERSQESFTQQLMIDLEENGLFFDREQVVYQSQRTMIYEQYYQELIQKEKVYPCYCHPDELALERKLQLAQGIPPRYSGRCRQLSAAERQLKEASGEKPVLRFFVGHDKIAFDDVILGQKEFLAQDIGDFIIKKTDGQATFFFCNAIDDAITGVTHILRGDDHLTNTPRQLLILKSLNLPIPAYGHFPLILGFDHKPLSKRTGSRSIKDLLGAGYLPAALNNYLARLGHHLISTELFSLQQLAEHFDFSAIASGPAHFDQTQLDYWQKQAFAQITEQEKDEILAPYREQITAIDKFWPLVHPNLTRADELPLWIERLHEPKLTFFIQEMMAHGWLSDHLIIAGDSWGKPWPVLLSALKEQGLKGKNLFMPLRLLMTGLEDGPPLEALYEYVAQDMMKQRLQGAIDAFKTL